MQNSATNIKLEKVFKVKGTPKGNINKKVNKKREQEETPKTEWWRQVCLEENISQTRRKGDKNYAQKNLQLL